jgi:hypothetical protein
MRHDTLPQEDREMPRAGLIAIAAAAALTATVVAQTTPNFAGTWKLVPDATASAGAGRAGGLGPEATIVQDATSLTITRFTQMGEFKSVYRLDGSESRNVLDFQGNSIDQLSTTKWDGGKLIVNTKMEFSGNLVEVSMTMALDASGNLIVENTRPDFQGGGAPVTTKATYKKN